MSVVSSSVFGCRILSLVSCQKAVSYLAKSTRMLTPFCGHYVITLPIYRSNHLDYPSFLCSRLILKTSNALTTCIKAQHNFTILVYSGIQEKSLCAFQKGDATSKARGTHCSSSELFPTILSHRAATDHTITSGLSSLLVRKCLFIMRRIPT